MPRSKALIELNPEALAPPPRSVGTHGGSAAWMTERSVLLWVILSQRFKNSQFGFISKASFSSFPVLENCTGFGVCSEVPLRGCREGCEWPWDSGHLLRDGSLTLHLR